MAYYLQYHLPTTPDVSSAMGGLCASLSAWKHSGKTSPLVDLALSCLALAVFARTQNHPPAIREGSFRYVQLLTAVRARMTCVRVRQKTETCIDDVLLAIALMRRYEGLSSLPEDPSLKRSFKAMRSAPHDDGAMAVLKAWYYSSTHSAATDVIKQSRRGVITSLLLRELPLPQWMHDGKLYGESGIDIKLDCVLVRIVGLRCQVATLRHDAEQQDALVQESLRETEDLQESLREWATHLPRTCLSLQYPLSKSSDRQQASHSISMLDCYYASTEEAVLWSHYFSTHMFIISTRLRLMRFSRLTSLTRSRYNDEEQLYENNMKMAADGLASTIPFVLGRLEMQADESVRPNGKRSVEFRPYVAGLAVWQLTFASSLQGVEKRQQYWFRSMLATLGRVTGDGMLGDAKSDDWPVL